MAREVTILGAGLVGSLLAIIMRKRGHEVTIYERRGDMRAANMSAGKSINLAMSARGWKALELAGLREDMEPIAIPMYGRYLHQADGNTAFQPYSKNNEAIYSVSRGELNRKLMTLAEQNGAQIHFEHRCTGVDVAANVANFEVNGAAKTVTADLLFGADGAFSALRESYTKQPRVNASQNYLEYGYKELTIVPGKNGEWVMEKNALHIWPRGKYMMIALPNTDGTFTCTMFMPFEGEGMAFDKLKTEADVTALFDTQFADAKALMPGLLEDFFANPTGLLITTHIFPWHHKDKSALIGDAAHAIVPFYGQGMNAGFEDVSVLAELLQSGGSTGLTMTTTTGDDDWGAILAEYERRRKPNGDAVAQLALQNFTEMRDKVADPMFLERKKIEKELGKRYPEQFVSVYEMVSFSHTPYNTAMQCIQAQDRLLGQIMQEGDFFANVEQVPFCDKLGGWVSEYHNAVQQLDFGV